LSIACGHLREAQLSQAVQNKAISQFIALDQDPLSLELIKTELSGYGITTQCNSVTSILRRKLTYENLDFVYSAGLYDYLSQSTAIRLTALLFSMLRPGGKLLVANFVPHDSIGYMETFMQWFLIYRTPEQVAEFTKEIEPEQIAQQQMFYDEHQNIIFLELIKA
jgi:hypothetical protein